MSDAGRPPKPTALKLLHGDDKVNPSRINRGEPVPDEAEVVPPFRLTRAAQEVWDRLAPGRRRAGVLTSWDVDAFAEFCEAVVLLRAKRRGARRRPVQGAASPMSEYKAAVQIVSTLGSRFGWTPSDRAKLVVREARDDDDGEDLLSGAG